MGDYNRCKKCGQCCRGFRIPGFRSEDWLQVKALYPFLRKRYTATPWGIQVVWDCTRLVSDGNGCMICSDYNNRPQFCKAFPETNKKQPTPEGCGFRD